MKIYTYHVITDTGFCGEYRVCATNSIVAVEELRVMVEMSDQGKLIDFVLESIE